MTKFICLNCNDEYDRLPFGGYCDNTLACTGADLLDVETGNIVEAYQPVQQLHPSNNGYPLRYQTVIKDVRFVRISELRMSDPYDLILL